MQFRQWMLWMGVLFAAVAPGQDPKPQNTAGSTPIIRTETRVVLVDTVVTDKKGNYVRDLNIKNFRVWEDSKEQSITSVTYEADPASPDNSQRRYMVLFFDNSTMGAAEQAQARQAAEKFIDNNAGPNRMMAIADFGGSLRIAQNFTADAGRLKAVVKGVKFSAVSPNAGQTVQVASLGMPPLGNSESDFGVRSMILALRSLAKNLSTVPGRKTLVLFTGGFPLTNENRGELSAAIDACNRANVSVYPIDARGLVAPGGAAGPRGALGLPPAWELAGGSAFGELSLVLPSIAYLTPYLAFDPQAAGSRGGGGSSPSPAPPSRTGPAAPSPAPGAGVTRGNPGPGASGGRGSIPTGNTSNTGNLGRGGGGMPVNNTQSPYARNPYSQSRRILPEFHDLVSGNQEVLYMLANGTGGFVIVNTNDLLGGLEKIGREQSEYYIIGYTPAESEEGSCHSLHVKVDRGGTSVRARSGYCNAKPTDVLAGDPIEKELETRAAASAPGKATASMRAPFFYTSPDTARVNVALEIPSDLVKAEKKKGKLHASMNVLGIAYGPDNKVAARFSDAVKLEFANKKELEAFQEDPFHYENQFEIASGQYTLKVIFSFGGDNFGKVETPLTIEPYDGKKFVLSAVALSKSMHRVRDSGLDAELLEGKTPLVTSGVQVTPTGAARFAKNDDAALYVEVYDPLLAAPDPPEVGVQLRIVDRKTGEQKLDTGFGTVANLIRTGNPVIPVGFKIPVKTLTPGTYRAELKAMDTKGNLAPVRSADFEVQ